MDFDAAVERVNTHMRRWWAMHGDASRRRAFRAEYERAKAAVLREVGGDLQSGEDQSPSSSRRPMESARESRCSSIACM